MEGFQMSEDNKNLMPEPWVNLEDIAKHLSVSTDTIRAWIKKGTIPYSRAGKQYKFKISIVDEWVENGKITE
jgi:excisionase family DNA binding protein